MLLISEQVILNGSLLIQLDTASYLGMFYQKEIFNFAINEKILYRICAVLFQSTTVINIVMWIGLRATVIWFETYFAASNWSIELKFQVKRVIKKHIQWKGAQKGGKILKSHAQRIKFSLQKLLTHTVCVSQCHKDERCTMKNPSRMKQESYDNGKQSGCHEINVIYSQYRNKEKWINGKCRAFFVVVKTKQNNTMYVHGLWVDLLLATAIVELNIYLNRYMLLRWMDFVLT